MKYFLLSLILLTCSLHLIGGSGQQDFIVIIHATPDTICQGQQSQLSVTIQGGQGPYTYLWTPAATLSNPTIPNPIASPLESTCYQLVVTDQLMNTSSDSIIVNVKTIPPPPSPVTGPTHVCVDTTCIYSVDTIPGATSYSWTVPAGAIIQSGQNSHSIQLHWGNNSGTVSVIIGNECGTSVPGVLFVNVTPIPPASTGIEGPSHLCQSDTGTYYTDTIPFAETYSWKIPADALILSGGGTSSVIIKWGISAGFISVSGENSCGSGPIFSIPVALDSLPASAGPITGPDTVCIGKGSYTYSIDSLPFATSYGWTLPKGAVITSGQDHNRINVEFGIGATSGPITAFGINSCGNGQASIKPIITKNCTGIKNIFSSGITILPNPVSDKLYLHFKGPESAYGVLIMDQLGKILYRGQIKISKPEQIIEIDATYFPHIMLYLNIFNENGSFKSKFIVH